VDNAAVSGCVPNFDRLGDDAERLMDDLSGAKQAAIPREELMEFFDRGLLFLNALLNSIDGAKLKGALSDPVRRWTSMKLWTWQTEDFDLTHGKVIHGRSEIEAGAIGLHRHKLNCFVGLEKTRSSGVLSGRSTASGSRHRPFRGGSNGS
jgi:hypothetical protein